MAIGLESNVRSGLLVLQARTPLHPGTGTALGAVDLPVQRERFTGWPTIAGSALKGVLRDACRERAKEKYLAQTGSESPRRRANEQDPELTAVFGPGAVTESRAHAGALSVTDARLLAFPVRSLRGVFAWVTCPSVVDRLIQDIQWSSMQLDAPPSISNRPGRNEALVAGGEVVVHSDREDTVVLEEYEFRVAGTCDALARWMSQSIAVDPLTSQRLGSHLVVLHDDDFTHFARYATEVTARIALDYDTKTVSDKALFYQEYLPAETVFYAVVIANETRVPTANTQENEGESAAPKARRMSATEVLGYLKEQIPRVLQIGADETVGKGFCAVRLLS